jgi:GMP synthase-like glutamine amidotransferase
MDFIMNSRSSKAIGTQCSLCHLRAKILATNGHTPIQAFSLDERIFGVQFHPEMDGDILRRLWTERRERLRGEVSFDLDQALDSAEADASRIFHNFVAMLQ